MEWKNIFQNPPITVIMRTILLPIASQLLLYVVQFLVIPRVIFISPADAKRNRITIIATSAILSFVVMILFADNFLFWLIGIVLYYIAVMIHCPDALYGIGYGLFSIKNISITIITLSVLGTEFAVWVITRIIKIFI